MANFNDTYKTRNSGNNIAEDKMLDYFKGKGVTVCRFGFDEKQENIESKAFFKIPEEIRSAPDYIVVSDKAVFMEVKGFSGSLKVKRKDLVNYEIWNRVMPVYFFIYNAKKSTARVIGLDDLNKLVDRDDTTFEWFPDNGKRYFNITM